MNKVEFDKLLLAKKEAFEEVINEWQKGYLFEKYNDAIKDNLNHVTILPQDIDPELDASIEEVANYLEKNGFTVTRFFANEMSGKSKSFVLEI